MKRHPSHTGGLYLERQGSTLVWCARDGQGDLRAQSRSRLRCALRAWLLARRQILVREACIWLVRRGWAGESAQLAIRKALLAEEL